MINHHYPILNQCSSHHQPVDFSSTYPKLRVTCPSLANLAVSEHRVCPRPKTSRLKGFPKKQVPKPPKPWTCLLWSSWSFQFSTEVLGYPGLTIPSIFICFPPHATRVIILQFSTPSHLNSCLQHVLALLHCEGCFLGQMLQLPLHLRSVQTDQEMGMWLKKQPKMEVL